MRTSTCKFSIRKFLGAGAMSLAVAFGVSEARADRLGLPVDSDNQDQFEDLGSNLVCYTGRSELLPVPGRLLQHGSQRFFLSFLQVKRDEVARLKSAGRLGAENSPRFKLRKKKLTDPIRQGKSACIRNARIRLAVAASLASSRSPDASLGSFVDFISTIFNGSTNLNEDYLRSRIAVLRAFRSKTEFDALVPLMQSTGKFFELSGAPSEASPLRVAAATCPAEFEAVLYLVNGVNDTPFSTLMDGILFRELAFRSNPVEAGKIGFRYAYNGSGLPSATGADLCRLFVGPGGGASSESERQANIAKLPERLQPLASAYDQAFVRCLSAYSVSADQVQSLSQYLQSAASYSPGTTTIENLRDLVSQDVESGRKVILLSHGVGARLAQRAIENLKTDLTGPQQKAVGLLALAVPYTIGSSQSFGAFSFVNLKNDISDLVTGAPAFNTTNELSQNAALSPETHRFAVNDFATSYLGDGTLFNQIVSSIVNQEKAVTNARTKLGQGYFQVTLTWDIAGDIDLHIFEPNGSHVFYASKNGQVGQLDRDDIPGIGPENYFVCSRARLQSGNYRVEVNNYGGMTGTVAKIAIRGGNQSKTYNVTVGAANGGAENLPVAIVNYNGAGRFVLP